VSKGFLTAEWRRLAIANYAVDPDLLRKYLPYKTELDLWNNTCYISLVGFMFVNTKLKGVKIPFHSDFQEVNLRFYVGYKHESDWRRGVVFIKEFVPKLALTWVANRIYQENYETIPMEHKWETNGNQLETEYRWKHGDWNSFHVQSDNELQHIETGSEAEFIAEHYWGYTKCAAAKTSEYAVEHPQWKMYTVQHYSIKVDFLKCYGNEFAFLSNEKPASVFLAEGSDVQVKEKAILL